MSIKLHILYSYLDHFPSNLGDVSDGEEEGERFHLNISMGVGRIFSRGGGNSGF